ncbi:MAG: hypothetical protein L6R00_00340 [Phycisphaerae bacterium]|nr:hypothetical protein [Phycisphaerae bacterium]
MFRLLSLGALLLIMPARRAVGFQPDCTGIDPPQDHVVENFLPEGGRDM